MCTGNSSISFIHRCIPSSIYGLIICRCIRTFISSICEHCQINLRCTVQRSFGISQVIYVSRKVFPRFRYFLQGLSGFSVAFPFFVLVTSNESGHMKQLQWMPQYLLECQLFGVYINFFLLLLIVREIFSYYFSRQNE